MQSNSYQLSHQKDSRASVFSGFRKSQKLLLSSWMKLSIHLEDDIKKDVLCI